VSRLAKSDAFASAVLFDELDASSFKSMPYRRFVRERNWNFPINNLDPTDRCDPYFGCRGSRSCFDLTAVRRLTTTHAKQLLPLPTQA
jgi:hypothetical protein